MKFFRKSLRLLVWMLPVVSGVRLLPGTLIYELGKEEEYVVSEEQFIQLALKNEVTFFQETDNGYKM